MNLRTKRLAFAYVVLVLLMSVSATRVFANSSTTYPAYSGSVEQSPSNGCSDILWGTVCADASASSGIAYQDSSDSYQGGCDLCSGNVQAGTYVYYLNPVGTYGDSLTESSSPGTIYLTIGITANGYLDSNTDSGNYNAEAALGYNLNYSYPGGSTLYIVTIQYSHDYGMLYYLTECGLSDPSECLFYFSVSGSGTGTYREAGGPFTGVTAGYSEEGTGSATANYDDFVSPYYYQITVDCYEISDTVP